MSESGFPSWRTLPPALRAIWRWLTLVQVVGYTVSLISVRVTTRIAPSGIADHYRGSESADGAMQFPKSFAEMLTITHTHLLSMAVIFALSGTGLSLCERVSGRWKRWLGVEPFVAILVSFASMWLMRYVDPRFSLLLLVSSGLMAATFYAQSLLVLRELGWGGMK
jgi:hypothetical protein